MAYTATNLFSPEVGSFVQPKWLKGKKITDIVKFPNLLLADLFENSMVKINGSQDARWSIRGLDNPVQILTNASDEYATSTKNTQFTGVAAPSLITSNKFIADADLQAVKGESAVADYVVAKKAELENDVMKMIEDMFWNASGNPSNIVSVPTIISDTPSAAGTTFGIDNNLATSYGFKVWQNGAYTGLFSNMADIAGKVETAVQFVKRTGMTGKLRMVAGTTMYYNLQSYAASLGRNTGSWNVGADGTLKVSGIALELDVGALVPASKLYILNPESFVLAYWGDEMINFRKVDYPNRLGQGLVASANLALACVDRSANAVVTGS